jgi:hypothetical protein
LASRTRPSCGIIKIEGVFRGFASSVLSLVVVATFLWGGCVSCEQYFMFPGKHQPCCNKSGQCERPGKNSPQPEKQDCNRLAFQRNAPAGVPLPAVLPTPIAPILVEVSAFLVRIPALDIPPDPSPPDSQALNATFLI